MKTMITLLAGLAFAGAAQCQEIFTPDLTTVEGSQEAQRINHRHELYDALRTRVLTHHEMREALEYGDALNVENGVWFDPAERSKDLLDAFRQQERLRR
jgi:hypothetical protein